MHFYKKKKIPYFFGFSGKKYHILREKTREGGTCILTCPQLSMPLIRSPIACITFAHYHVAQTCARARTHTQKKKKNSNISVHLFGRINKITCFPSQCRPAFYFDNVCKAAEHTILKIITFAKCCSSSLLPPRMFLCLMINTAKDPTYIKNIN